MLKCPNCGTEPLILKTEHHRDTGEPDYYPGYICPTCDEFALEEEWESDDDER